MVVTHFLSALEDATFLARVLAILERLPKTDKVNYMLAIVYSRLGETEMASI